MKKMIMYLFLAAFFLSCNSKSDKDKVATTDSTINAAKPAIDLPYKASFSSQFTTDVSDADLKTVLQSYVDWAAGNMSQVAKAYGDTLTWDRSDGSHFKLPNDGIMKMWGTFHDSLSSVTIDMQAWQKMYATDKKEGFIVTWYKEIDTYKTGKADSGYYQDINKVDNGRITALQQYKRPAK